MLARLMGRTVRELKQSMGADELAEHYADYVAETYGPERDDIRHALLCSQVAAAAGVRVDPMKCMPFEHQRAADEIIGWQAAKSALGASGG